MKRSELLKKLGFKTYDNRKKRVIIHSDIAAEADDQFAIVHHLLTPTEDVVGIIAANFEWRFRTIPSLKPLAGHSLEQSYEEGIKLLKLMDIDDVPLFKGARNYIEDRNNLPISEGSRFIIEEAMKDDERPLYIALQGTLTDLAVAYLVEPKIANRITAIWIGGGTYPNGGQESNLQQDIYAAQVLFNSPMMIWQIPLNVYASSNISFAELMIKIKPFGKIGNYLVEHMFEVNDFYGKIPHRMSFPHGELWSIGDSPTISALLENESGQKRHTIKAPIINDDMSYSYNENGKTMIVYDDIDRRLLIEDLYCKLKLCFSE